MAVPGQRIRRDYRNQGCTKFHDFNQTVCTCLADKSRFPDTFWGSNLHVIETYLSTSVKYDTAYHGAKLGGKAWMSERDLLQAQLVLLLDQIASLLDMTAVCNPEVLVVSGFSISKDRRGMARGKAAVAAVSASNTDHSGGESDTPA